ncbi:MAG: hypothetical protein KAX80_09410 [Planctomycetes bacterium]|nr:hypothetical protein [Planctomycetota bacterium]
MRSPGTVLLAAIVAAGLGWAVVEAEAPVGSGHSAVTVVGKPTAEVARLEEGQLGKKLETRLSVHFAGTPLADVLQYLREKGKLNIILNSDAPGVDPAFPVILKLDDVALRNAVAWVARLAGLVYVVRDEAIFLTPAADLSPEWSREIRARDQTLDRLAEKTWVPKVEAKLDQPTSFSFKDTPLREVLGFLASYHKLNVVLDARFTQQENTVTMPVEDMSVRNALGWILRLKHLEYALVDEAIFVSTPTRIRSLRTSRRSVLGDPRFRTVVDVEFSEIPIQRALDALSIATGLNIALRAEQVPPVRLTMKLDHVTLEQAVRELVAQTGFPFAFSFEKDGLVIWLQEPSAEPTKEVEQAGPEKPETQPSVETE